VERWNVLGGEGSYWRKESFSRVVIFCQDYFSTILDFLWGISLCIRWSFAGRMGRPVVFAQQIVFRATAMSISSICIFRGSCSPLCASAPFAVFLAILNTENPMPSRDNAWKLLCEYTQSDGLRKHMLAVEACVRAYARKNGADEDLWGVTALLHDFDYERWPNNAHLPDQEHPAQGAAILRELGYSEEIVRAILSHADYCNVPRQTPLEHTLFACDELAGFLTACSLVRPSKSILDLEVDSVKRRMKDKAFAKGVSRDDVRKGAEALGIPVEEHIHFCIAALREHADALGLRGTFGAQAASS
jgi:putative nucleotidyltransferase with HDIG domain